MMMNCEQALEAISARLDGALSEEENRELETHLASCASCRALLKELTPETYAYFEELSADWNSLS